MATVLYISLTGMTEPLGESQVVQYLLELVKSNTIHLLSFEKPVDKDKYARMKEKLSKAGIKWTYFEYSNRYGVLSTLKQITVAFFMMAKLVRKDKVEIIHARSLIPAVIGMLLTKISNAKLLFDIRGFAIDEKIMDGRLKQNSWLVRALKKLEQSVYKHSDHIVTLTHASKPIMEEKYHIKREDITVIPTCANMELFKTISADEKCALRAEKGFSGNDFVILHNGSLNNWVDFDAEIKLFEQLAQMKANIKFLFLNKGQHALIQSYLEKSKIESQRYKIFAADFDQVCNFINLSDLCVFFIKPSFSKQASAPTKFAELVACHLPSITNTQYGDMEYYLNSYRVGMLLDLQEVHLDPKKSAHRVMKFVEQDNQQRHVDDFDHLFSQHFSKQVAVERYLHVYESLKKGML